MTDRSIKSEPGVEDQAQHPHPGEVRNPVEEMPDEPPLATKHNVFPDELPGVDTTHDIPEDDRVVPKDGQPNYIPGQPEPKGFV